ncbi:glutathione S-transferase family protein [uncultured Roseibium sp.]|uniref:glutathione S-transferase family protein n=1 Tax=uncultured Roseibium sp. TaxID=1936171 RepID=UPI002605D20C|nr:glutathione S-transferase family protein [uncultured Roseibium sp.]
MKLLSQTHSPFARKVVVLIHELGRSDISIEHQETSPTNANPAVSSLNPLGKVPVLILSDETPLYDSAVICEYLCSQEDKTPLLPTSPDKRMRTLRQQALASGMCETGIAIRWEIERRPEHLRYETLRDGLIAKLAASYAYLEQDVPREDEVTVGTIALACALDWATFRELDQFMPKHENLKKWMKVFSQRSSMRASAYAGQTHD